MMIAPDPAEHSGTDTERAWPERGSCPRCDSDQVLHHLIGMPTIEVVEDHPSWVILEGCLGLGPDFTCADCGMGWFLEPDWDEEHELGEDEGLDDGSADSGSGAGPGDGDDGPPVPRVREVGAIIVRERTVLVGRRRADAVAGGTWEFPGGVVEDREPPRLALRRNLRATLGAEVRLGHYASHARMEADTADEGPHELEVICYWARLEAGEPAPDGEHDELRWVPWEQLAALWPWNGGDAAIAASVQEDLTGDWGGPLSVPGLRP